MIKVQLEIGKKVYEVYENEENWQMADNENQIRKKNRNENPIRKINPIRKWISN